MKPPHHDYECPVCNEWVEILATTDAGNFRCPWCNERLRLDADGEFVDGSWKDLSKLVTYCSHWDE